MSETEEAQGVDKCLVDYCEALQDDGIRAAPFLCKSHSDDINAVYGFENVSEECVKSFAADLSDEHRWRKAGLLNLGTDAKRFLLMLIKKTTKQDGQPHDTDLLMFCRELDKSPKDIAILIMQTRDALHGSIK